MNRAAGNSIDITYVLLDFPITRNLTRSFSLEENICETGIQEMNLVPEIKLKATIGHEEGKDYCELSLESDEEKKKKVWSRRIP